MRRTVAKPPAPKRTSLRKGASFTSALSGVRLLYPVLMDCDLQRYDPPNEGEEPERFYDAVLRPVLVPDTGPGTSKNFAIASCEFAAGTKTAEEKIVEVSATYLIAIDCMAEGNAPVAETRALLAQLAAVSAWPLYRDLFIHLGSQSGLELPLLPNNPKFRWGRADDAEEVKQD